MSFVTYKIGQCIGTIQFDQVVRKLKEKLVNNFSLLLDFGYILKPTVMISAFPPYDFQKWHPYSYKTKDILIYFKFEDEKIYFHLQIVGEYYQVADIAFKCIITSLLLNNDVLYLHAMLLNNGDIIFGNSNVGKTTLAKRINENNLNLKVICDDGIILNLKKFEAYSIPYFYEEEKGISKVDFNVVKHINKIYMLKRDEKQFINIIDKNIWINQFFNCARMYLYHPFCDKGEDIDNITTEFWCNCIDGLKQVVQNRIKNLIQKYVLNFEPLQITTNTSQIQKKFQVLSDD